MFILSVPKLYICYRCITTYFGADASSAIILLVAHEKSFPVKPIYLIFITVLGLVTLNSLFVIMFIYTILSQYNTK